MRNRRWSLLLTVLLLAIVLAGCAKFQARTAFEEAEQAFAEEKYDQAVEQYFKATQEDPGSKAYKLKLIAARTRAAADHVEKARKLVKEDRLEEALAQYRLARGFDPGAEVAALEFRKLQVVVDARKKLEDGFVRYREKRYAAARQIAHEVLKVDPLNVRANELLKLLEARYQAVVMDGIELDIASNEPITLRLKNANVKEVFGILTKLSGINFILDDEIKDKPVTILMEKATFSQAMELIMSMAGLNKKILNSKTMIIYTQGKEKEKQYEDQIIQSFYLSHIDAKKAVNLLRTMLQLRKVYVHEERNALVIRDTPDTIKLAEQVLKSADRENSEVIFDLEIIAVGNTDALNFGPKLSSYSIGAAQAERIQEVDAEGDLKFNTAGNPIYKFNRVISALPETGVDGLIKSLDNLQTFYTLPTASFDFAKTLTDTEILASPKIRVRNSEKAKVHIGTREPVITVTSSGTDQFSDNIQYVDVGVKLDVEPTIQLDQTVQTKLSLEVSQVIDRFETAHKSVALTISTTNAQTVLTLKDGLQTIIGGLFEQNEKKSKATIPFIGDIPLLGNLISSFNNSDNKREILLSITPHIVKQIEVPESDVATIWSGGEEDLMARPKFGAFAQPLVSEVEAVAPAAAPSMAKPARPATAPVKTVLTPDHAPTAPQTPAAPVAPASPLAPEVVPTTPPGVPVSAEVVPATPPGLPVVTDVAPAPVPPSEAPPATNIPPAEAAPAEAPVAPAAPVTVTPPPVETPPPVAPTAPAEAPIVLPMPPKSPAKLSLEETEKPAVGQEFTLAVQVNGIERLYSAPLFVSYDPTLLEFVDAQEGTFLGQSGQTTVFSYSPNPTTGQVVVGYKQGVGGQGASGSGSLFTLRFRARAAGSAKVELNRVNFRDPAGTRLPVEPATAGIMIR